MRTITFIIIGAVLLTIHPIKAQPNQKEKLYYDKIRIGLTSVLSNEKIYFFGGEIFNEIDSSSTISKEFFTLDVSSLELHNSKPLNNSMFKDKWELLDSTEQVHGLKNHVMALSNHGNDSTIIFLEGEPLNLDTREAPSRIYEYDIDQEKWVINPKYHGTLPPHRLSFASVTQNMEDGIIYLFGGIFNPNSKGEGRVNNQLYSIDTKDKRWDVLPVKNLPPGVFGSTCNLMKDGKIVFIGGAYFHPSNKVKLSRMNNLNVYDTINNRWSLRTIFDKDSPEGRFGHTATLHGNEIIIVGGKNVENQKASNPYFICLDLDEWRWKHQDVGQAYYDGFARFGHNAILLGDYLFITFGKGVNKVKEILPIEIINTKSFERIVQQPTNSDQVVTIQSEPTFVPPGESDVNNDDGGDDYNNPEESDLKGSDGESSSRNQSIIIILSVVGGITLLLSFLVAFLIFYVRKHLKFTNPDNSRTRQSTRSINYLSILTRNTQPNQENSKNPDEISLFNLSQSPSPTGVNKTIDDTLSIEDIQSPSTTYLKTIATIEKTPTVIYASGVPSISADISFASPNQ